MRIKTLENMREIAVYGDFEKVNILLDDELHQVYWIYLGDNSIVHPCT
jgi:hypothetical protein